MDYFSPVTKPQIYIVNEPNAEVKDSRARLVHKGRLHKKKGGFYRTSHSLRQSTNSWIDDSNMKDRFLANVLRYVRYMARSRPSVVCLSVVCDVGAPYSGG